MKKLILILGLGLMLSTSVFAEVFSYESFYDDTLETKLDFKFDVEMTKYFSSKSKVSNIKIWGKLDGKDVLLFDLSPADITTEWIDVGVLKIKTKGVITPVYKDYYPSENTDEGISPEIEYSLMLVIDRRGTVGDYGLSLDNQTDEEMVLGGVLRRIQ